MSGENVPILNIFGKNLKNSSPIISQSHLPIFRTDIYVLLLCVFLSVKLKVKGYERNISTTKRFSHRSSTGLRRCLHFPSLLLPPHPPYFHQDQTPPHVIDSQHPDVPQSVCPSILPNRRWQCHPSSQSAATALTLRCPDRMKQKLQLSSAPWLSTPPYSNNAYRRSPDAARLHQRRC